ncbi:MAG: DUF29 domain-containing protein [Gammaproteobacteria bacterium]
MSMLQRNEGMSTKPDVFIQLHDADFYTWAMETAQAIRERRFAGIEWDAVAEELEDMGRSEQKELRNRFSVLLAHLLKWRHQPQLTPNRSWALTIKEQRYQLRLLLKHSPGLKRMLDETFKEAYEIARIQAARESGLEEDLFPETCLWTVEQVMDDGFWPK